MAKDTVARLTAKGESGSPGFKLIKVEVDGVSKCAAVFNLNITTSRSYNKKAIETFTDLGNGLANIKVEGNWLCEVPAGDIQESFKFKKDTVLVDTVLDESGAIKMVTPEGKKKAEIETKPLIPPITFRAGEECIMWEIRPEFYPSDAAEMKEWEKVNAAFEAEGKAKEAANQLFTALQAKNTGLSRVSFRQGFDFAKANPPNTSTAETARTARAK